MRSARMPPMDDVDDAAAAPRLHALGRRLQRDEPAPQVHLQDLLPFVDIDSADLALGKLEAPPGADAGIGEHHVEPTVLLRNGIDRRAQASGVANVEPDRFDGAPGFFEPYNSRV